MPFGIPVDGSAEFGNLVNAVEDNTADLKKFGVSTQQALSRVGAANQADLSRAVNRLSRSLNGTRGANTNDLNTVANSLAVQLAGAAQANQADIAAAQAAPVTSTAPAQHFAVYVEHTDPSFTGACRWVVIGYTDEQQLLPIDPATGFWLFSSGYPDQANAECTANNIVHNLGCPTAPARDCSQIGVTPPGNGNGTTGNGTTTPPQDNFAVVGENLPTPCRWVVYQYQSAQQLDHYLAQFNLALDSQGLTVDVAGARATFLNSHLDPACTPNIGTTTCPPGQNLVNGVCETPTCGPEITCGPGTHEENGECVPDPIGTTEPKQPVGPDCSMVDWGSILPFGSLPSPGTPEFCDFLNGLEPFADAIVNLLQGWLADPNNSNIGGLTDAIASLYDPNPGLNPVKQAINAVVSILTDVLNYHQDIIDLIVCALRNIINLVYSLSPQCGSNLVIALLFAKWTLGAVKDFQIGINFGLEGLDWVHLDFGPYEKYLDMLIEYMLPVEIPSIPEATEAWLKGEITASHRDCIWRLNGQCPSTYLPFAMAQSERLSPLELLQYSYRKDWTDQERDVMLQQRGWKIDAERSWRQELHWELPTIQDHLHWLSRNVDDRDYVQRFGLLDGFAPIQFIHEIPGWQNYQIVVDPGHRDFWGTYGHDLMAQGMRPEVAAFHYAAHWIQPSPEQMREFVYRLRPGAPGMEVTFTPEDFERILTEQDYAPLARKWFVATLARVPALTYIIGMYRMGVIGDEQLKNYHQDLGYTLEDSERFVSVDRLQKNRMRANEYHGWTPAKIANAYAIGKLDPVEVKQKLAALGGTSQEASDLMRVAEIDLERQVWMRARTRLQWRTATRVQQALQVGSVNADQAVAIFTNLGYPENYARGVVEAEQATSRTSVVKQTVASVKRALHDGYIIGTQAVELLQAVGIVQEKIDEYLALWGIQNTPTRKRRTAAQIVTDLSLGMMDTAEALFRLQNLGYDNADSLLYLADAQRKIISRQQRADAARQRDARTQAQTLARLQRQAQSQARQLRSELTRIAPRSVLSKWLKKGIISIAQFKARMDLLGYPAADIARYAADAPTQPTVKELQQWIKDGEITDAQFFERLIELGFTQADAETFRRDATRSTATTPQPSPTP